LLLVAVLVGTAWVGFWRNQRRSQRYHCFISGAMQGDLYCEATELLDISRSGCKLRLHAQIDPKKPVTLFMGNWTIHARTVWSNSHYAAVKFDTALTPSQLRNIFEYQNKPRDGNGPLVPSLSCHDTTCRATCLNYKMMQRQKARMSPSATGRIKPVT
jgi:hypothetical protein